MLKDNKNQELIVELLNGSHEFKKLYEQHVSYEQDLEALYSLKYFPPEVEQKIRDIKKQKLCGKDKMLNMMAEVEG